MTISCPDTKFFDPSLQGESSVQVKCGPQKYRLTVTTETGALLGENFMNDQFGCGKNEVSFIQYIYIINLFRSVPKINELC